MTLTLTLTPTPTVALNQGTDLDPDLGELGLGPDLFDHGPDLLRSPQPVVKAQRGEGALQQWVAQLQQGALRPPPLTKAQALQQAQTKPNPNPSPSPDLSVNPGHCP